MDLLRASTGARHNLGIMTITVALCGVWLLLNLAFMVRQVPTKEDVRRARELGESLRSSNKKTQG